MTTERSALDPGEEIIWSGRPSPVWPALRIAKWQLLAGLLFLSGAVSFFLAPEAGRFPTQTSKAYSDTLFIGRIFFSLAAIFGAFGILAAVWLAWRACRTRYFLTPRRVLIDTTGPFPRRTSMPLEHLRFIELQTKFLGPGDLVFNETRRTTLDGWGARGEGFLAIWDAAQVEPLVTAAVEQTFATRSRGPWQ